jgi:hypothetical protein
VPLIAIALALGSYQIHAQTDGPEIRLRAATFDPITGEPALAAQNPATLASNTENTYLVQFRGPVRASMKDAVRQLGARLYDPIPEHAFLARMDDATATQVEALDVVRWVGPYHPAYRLAPGLANDDTSLQASASITVTVQVLPDSDLDAIAADITARGGSIQGRDANIIAGYIDAIVPPASIADIARLDGVIWIEPDMPIELDNDVGGGGVMRVDQVRQELGLYGTGQIVGVADSGLDTGNLSTLHPDVAGRVIATECIGRSNPCDWSDPGGHGTHVAGSVLGDGSVSGSDPATSSYAGSYAGTAPEAQLVIQSLDSGTGGLLVPSDAGDLVRTAYAEGARIHTNSWGSPTDRDADGLPIYDGTYTSLSQEFDVVTWENKDILVLNSAGNSATDSNGDGIIDLSSLGQPKAAKNLLLVGASENNRPAINNIWGSRYSDPISSDLMADNPNGMAAFSSRGPTADGRIKPDVAAPGTFIASLRSRAYPLNDDLEGDISSYETASLAGGATSPWQLVSDARSGSSALNQTISGTFAADAGSIIFTPPFDAESVGSIVELNMWHKYNLASNNYMGLALRGPNINNPTEMQIVILGTSFLGTQDSFAFHRESFSNATIRASYSIDPTQLQIGFFIGSNDTTFASSWTIDDIRIDGYEWDMMHEANLAEAGDPIDEAYKLNGGTSMATPLTAGTAALVREWLIEQGQSAPSSALMKALIMNGAADMRPGQYDTGSQQEIPNTVPNNVSGWGRVDALNSLSPAAPRQIWYTDEQTGVGTSELQTYSLTVTTPDDASADTFRVSLVWTDYPGSLAADKALVNDLDLEVVAPDGTIYTGNQGVYPAGSPCLRGSADACNNAETVMIPLAADGAYTITVQGYEVSEGDPTSGKQPFALVAFGNGIGGAAPPPDDPQLGDCNVDDTIDAADITATILRVFGLDFLSSPACDSNDDDTVDAGDVSCTVLLAFGETCDGSTDPDPDTPQELISNGSFEESTDWAGTTDGLFFTTSEAHTGERSLRFVEAMNNQARQSVTFPQNLDSAELTFYWKSVDPDPYTSLNPLDGDVLQAILCDPTNDCATEYGISDIVVESQGTWQQTTLTVSAEDLALLPGKTVDVTFFKTQDNTEPHTTFFIDDVSLLVTTTSLSGSSATPSAAPMLSIGSAQALGSSVALPVSLNSGDTSVSSVAFSIDYDETRLALNPTDADGDGVPDALRLAAPDTFELVATFDASDTNGEIDIFIGDIVPPLAALPDNTILSVTFDLVGQPTGTAAVNIADAPAVSFGTLQGASAPGSSTDGLVRLNQSDSLSTLYLPLVQR